MKKFLIPIIILLWSLTASGQQIPAFEQLRTDPKKAYGNDYPYLFTATQLTPAPRGYKPFYISHYARHGSRYYWNDRLYKQLDTLMHTAKERHLLTDEGEAFYASFVEAEKELMTGVSELTDLGWQQHQQIARAMYGRFPEVFRKGGNVLAISSLSGRCVLSMSAFCQELVQCNPEIEIREQSSRFTLDAVVPGDRENPAYREWPQATPRYEKNRAMFVRDTTLNNKVISRVFKSTEGLPGNMRQIAGNLVNLYTSLPNIGHEGMMGNILTDADIVQNWESSNLGSYSWVFGSKYRTIPILRDFISKADAVLDGSSDHIADLRFGHDSYIGPLTVLMGLDGADLDPEDPYEVKNCYQNWKTCKASNIQLVFYRNRRNPDDILVKCLLNEMEVTLPIETDNYPYYKWSDLRDFYIARCNSVDTVPSSKKEIMDSFVAGTLNPSYAPAAFFIHYKSDEKIGDAAVQAHLKYFRETGMDILKVQFEQSVPKINDLNSFEPIPEDYYRPTLEIISKLQKEEGADVYVLPTLYSAYQISHASLGEQMIRTAARETPDLYKAVLKSYSDALIWLVRECKKVGIQGFYMCTQGGEMMFYDIPGFFESFVRPYDMSVMGECAKDTKMNILHICNWEGPYDDLTRYKDYPGQIINTPDNLNGEPFSLTDGVELFGRPVLGGFNRKGVFNSVSPEETASMTKKILADSPKGRVMIGADCTVGSAPFANIQAAVAAAHGE